MGNKHTQKHTNNKTFTWRICSTVIRKDFIVFSAYTRKKIAQFKTVILAFSQAPHFLQHPLSCNFS